METGELVAGLDIGTTKIVCLIAEKDENGELSILARGEAKSEGLRKGVVVNIDMTAKAIRAAAEQAEKLSGVQPDELFVGIAGEHISSKTSSGMVTISGANKIVTKEDVRRVIEAAKAINVPNDREIIHIIPLEFTIDGQDGIMEPVGMSGMRLTADIHIVTAAKASMQNLRSSVEKAGLTVKSFVLEPLASSSAILHQDERDLGVCLIDIGGGTTDVAMYLDGALRYTSVIPLGGTNITNDLSLGLKTPYENAERVKTKFGIAHVDLVEDSNETIEIPGIGGRENVTINRKIVSQIIQPRVEEIFEMTYKELQRSELIDLMSAGAVITGGASMLYGTAEIAAQILGMPVKIGIPQGVTGLVDAVNEPKYATAVGLVKYAEEIQTGTVKAKGGFIPKFESGQGLFATLKKWFDDIL